MTPQKKQLIVQEIPTWSYRAIIGGMMTLLLIWFNDFRIENKELIKDHIKLKGDFDLHVGVNKEQIKTINDNIKTLAKNQNILFNNFTDPEVE